MRLRQLLTNLLNNAVAYGAPDRPVRVAAQRVTGAFVLTVTNEGQPIPEHGIATLFEPFRRGPTSDDGEQLRGHMGLGLSIVQQIVWAHGGRVFVESTRERTRFTACFPIP